MSVVARLLLLSVLLLGGAPQAWADPFCDVCTCSSGEIICVESENSGEVLEEQVVCGNACMSIGSTHGTRDRVDSACSEVPQCNGTAAPAAGPMWLGAAALGMLALGVYTMRRVRRNAA
jgi:MYXO-CTERM domain-containing protein